MRIVRVGVYFSIYSFIFILLIRIQGTQMTFLRLLGITIDVQEDFIIQ